MKHESALNNAAAPVAERKLNVIQRAQAAGSAAQTVHGACKYLTEHLGQYRRNHGLPLDREYRHQIDAFRRTSRRDWYRKQHRTRMDRRYLALGAASLSALGLLDRDQLRGLVAVTGSETTARKEAARLRRYNAINRTARLERLLGAAIEAAEVTRLVYDPLALDCAASYHRHISPIYQSSRASIVLGSAATEETDWHAYSKSYGRPANWKNPAVSHARIMPNASVDMTATIHTVRGKDITLPLHQDARYNHPALLDGDLYARVKHGIVVRYNPRDERTGVALRIPGIDGARAEWEHGKTISACRAEWERKSALRAAEAEAARHNPDIRARRKQRLIMRLCGGLACTVEDARAVGNCQAGIATFRQRYALGETATAAELRKTGRSEIGRVIEQAARRVAVGKS
jgi:hypothetical protein